MSDDPPTWEHRGLFGGQGLVTVRDLLRGRPAPPFPAVLGCTLSPGGSVGRHRQEQFPEIVVGLAGDGEAEVDGVAWPLGPGDVVHLPLGSVLSLRNRSAAEPLEYLIVKAGG
ncbi:MAG: cupin domain-containing protein [Myxococcota bacterium]